MSNPDTASDSPSNLQVAEGAGPSQDEEARVKAWLAELDGARKRESDFRKDARELVQIYEGQLRKEVPFNILYSNTETLSPALYNNTPRPVVKPRYRERDPLPKASATLTESYLEFFIDAGDADAAPFDELMLGALHEALVPGRGLSRFDYESDIEYAGDTPKKVRHEYICGKHVSYNDFLHGYAKRWSDVPWIAFRHDLTRSEVKENWPGKESEVNYYSAKEGDEDREKVEDADETSLATIYEVWDKRTKKVLFFADDAETFLSEKKDEYKLTGFFPVPRPLGFVTKISSLVPVSLYAFYEGQARELNTITLRIQVIIKAIKAVGFYNPLISGLDKVLELEDGMMHPLEGLAGLGDAAALSNAVWMWPAEKLVLVLQQLMEQRNAIKQVIYEITGISDILRGASNPHETATAQGLKNQWGSLRIKRFQKEVARYVRDCLRLAAELAFTMLSPDTLFRATATSLPRQKDHDEALARVQAIQAQAISAQAMLPPPGAMPGQPPGAPSAPAAPQPDPKDLAVIALPVFETVIKGLKSDLLRKYLIDIQLNSTVDVESTEDKANLTDFLTAMGQFFSGIAPLVESGTLPWEAAKTMLLTISRKFRLGRDLDDELSSMQKPEMGDGGGKAAAEMQKVLQERQKLEDDKKAHQVQTLQTQAGMEKQANGMKVQALQHAMKSAADETKVLLTALTAGMKDQKVKSEIEKLMIKLEAKQAQIQGDAEFVASELAHEHEQRRADLASAHKDISHTLDKGKMELDAKTKAAQAAAKARPPTKAKA